MLYVVICDKIHKIHRYTAMQVLFHSVSSYYTQQLHTLACTHTFHLLLTHYLGETSPIWQTIYKLILKAIEERCLCVKARRLLVSVRECFADWPGLQN